MKFIAIGDLHGSDHWKIIDLNNYDKIIFIGDYVDSFIYSDVEILHNLKKIIEFKKQNSDKVILLWGNHDYMYWRYPMSDFMCSGFRRTYQSELSDLFMRNHMLFKIAFQVNKYLFTHAGIISTWFKKYKKLYDRFVIDYNCKDIADFLNMLPYTSSENILATVGWVRGGSSIGSPIWADISETKKSLLFGYHQIAGHTWTKQIEHHKMQKNTSIIYIDCNNPRGKENFDFYELNIE